MLPQQIEQRSARPALAGLIAFIRLEATILPEVVVVSNTVLAEVCLAHVAVVVDATAEASFEPDADQLFQVTTTVGGFQCGVPWPQTFPMTIWLPC